MLEAGLGAQVRAWIAADPDPVTAAAATDLLEKAEAGDEPAAAELADAFAGPLEFGTAGLRGPLGPGPGRMNRVVVSYAAAGLGSYLNGLESPDREAARPRILVGFDARYNSEVFAIDTAEILAAQGFEVLVTSRPVPTPVVAFGIRELGCVAAVVVTASHNPPQDNGYKVYLGDGSQIVPPADFEIAAAIRAAEQTPIGELPRSSEFARIDTALLRAYADRIVALVDPDGPREISWVYTPMHGVGGGVVDEVVRRIGFPAGIEVAAQAEPDPAFPTVGFPNPEEPGAMDLALELAAEHGVDLVIANDPDADRCAVAIPGAVQGYRMLHGDELGALLADDFCRRGITGEYANSVVSGSMLHAIAAAYGQSSTITLTGFKWIGRVPGLAFGYEEAIGYCCDPAAVGDKDGISTLVTVLDLAARLKAGGLTIGDRLDELAATHGVHLDDQWSLRVEDLQVIREAMDRLRADPPTELCGQPVSYLDLADGWSGLPPTDAVRLSGAFVTVTVRPSGTEPKLKCYLEVRIPAEQSAADLAGSRVLAATLMAQLKTEIRASVCR